MTFQNYLLINSHVSLFCKTDSILSFGLLSMNQPKQFYVNDSLRFLLPSHYKIDTTKIFLSCDSLKIPYNLTSFPNYFSISSAFRVKQNYSLTFDTGAIFFDSLHSSYTVFSFVPHEEESFASLCFDIINPSKYNIVYLLFDHNTSLPHSSPLINNDTFKTVCYKNLQPGKYQLIVIMDENKNGYFDEGSFVHRITSERMLLSDIISLKPNWLINNIPIHIRK
jgi:hypothetical protein